MPFADAFGSEYVGHFRVGEARVNENFWPAALSGAGIKSRALNFCFHQPARKVSVFQLFSCSAYGGLFVWVGIPVLRVCGC